MYLLLAWQMSAQLWAPLLSPVLGSFGRVCNLQNPAPKLWNTGISPFDMKLHKCGYNIIISLMLNCLKNRTKTDLSLSI